MKNSEVAAKRVISTKYGITEMENITIMTCRPRCYYETGQKSGDGIKTVRVIWLVNRQPYCNVVKMATIENSYANMGQKFGARTLWRCGQYKNTQKGRRRLSALSLEDRVAKLEAMVMVEQ